MKFQVIQPFSIVYKGKSKTYVMGQRISENAYKNLNARQQGRFLPAAQCAKSLWTQEEYNLIAESYFLYGRNQAQCLNHFRKFSDAHSDQSVKIALYSCPALDTEVEEISGLKDHARGLLDALNAIEPGRFMSNKVNNKLDALLATIK